MQPTNSQPGSEEKILVMIARRENNEPIFHPGDRTVLPELRDGGYGGPASRSPNSREFRDQLVGVSFDDVDFDITGDE